MKHYGEKLFQILEEFFTQLILVFIHSWFLGGEKQFLGLIMTIKE